MSDLVLGFYFKDVDVVYFVKLQDMYNWSRSENDDVRKQEETEDKTNIQPIAYIRVRLLVQPLGILHTEQEDVQRDRESKKPQTKKYLSDLLSPHELLFLL